MSQYDDDITIVLFQPEANKPLEVLPSKEVSTNISLSEFKLDRVGINPLLDQFAWLFYFLSCVDQTPWVDDVVPLKEQLEREIKDAERRLQQLEMEKSVIMVVRFCTCLAIDEAIFRQEWGLKNEWSKYSLLATFHDEASGGEKFYAILDRLRHDPQRYSEVIEFLYMLIQLGFKGKFGVEERGEEKLNEIVDDLYRTIKEIRMAKGQQKPIDNLKPEEVSQPLRFVMSPKKIIGFSAFLLLSMYLGSHFYIEYHYLQLMELIEEVAR
ncbi:type IVB secretion system protein IcmH/DotU [Vibrio sp. WXL103]|uniref:type IVB secretion system protein IcmH/DotU n=1 Tax=Vibrio sp. WXL103 TaxID=3450710 RepID=UPI003EC7F495